MCTWDGVALSERYTRGLPSYTLASDATYPYTGPEGYLWMMGTTARIRRILDSFEPYPSPR